MGRHQWLIVITGGSDHRDVGKAVLKDKVWTGKRYE